MNAVQFFTSHKLLAFGLAVLIGTAIATGVALVLKNRRKPKCGTVRPSDPIPLPTIAAPTASTPSPSPIAPLPPLTWPQPPVQGNGISSNWAEFVRDRLGELDPVSCDNETKWALGVVDFLDELKEADAEASSEERASSASLRATLLACLLNKGFALEDSDEWNPDKQRAVAVVRKPDATATTILGKGSTGLSRNGKIIRKQEVKIVKKGN